MIQKWAAPLVVGGALFLWPTPTGLTPAAWHFFAIFAAVIAGLVTQPLPGSAIGFIGVTIAAVLQLTGDTPSESLRWALSGFSNGTVWLIFTATLFALGYETTGLGRRIALQLVRWLGRTTLGLGYAVALADLTLAPFMPSNTARSAGTIYPVVKSIPSLYDSSAEEHPRKIGAYLFWVAFATTCLTSSMFMTASAPNLLGTQFVREITGVDIDWMDWAIGFLPVGIPLFLLTPLLVYVIYPPEVRRSAEVEDWARSELALMGRFTLREATMSVLVISALAGWILGRPWISTTAVALVVVSAMMLTRILTWDDILQNRQAWDVLVWFATLVTMAGGLNEVGFLTWVAEHGTSALANLPPIPMIAALVALYFYVHYLFASLTAHTTALMPVFLVAIIGVDGIPLQTVVYGLIYTIGIMGVLTPYGTGPAPIYYSAGYISTKDFWRLGFLTGTLYLATMLILGLPLL